MIEITPDMSASILALAIGLFFVKHYVADFVLQNGWMSKGKTMARDWLLPLAAHAGIHALLTGIIFLVFAPAFALFAATVDLAIHGAIDRGKVMLSRKLSTDMEEPAFWWLLGADQMAHQFTHLAYAIWIASIAG